MSDDATQGLTAKIKSIATLVTALGALLAALGSWMKPVDTTMTQKSYDVLTQEIKQINGEMIKQADTINGLRGALDVIIRAQQISGYIHHGNNVGRISSEQQLFSEPPKVNLVPKTALRQPVVALPPIDRPREFKPRSFEQLK